LLASASAGGSSTKASATADEQEHVNRDRGGGAPRPEVMCSSILTMRGKPASVLAPSCLSLTRTVVPRHRQSEHGVEYGEPEALVVSPVVEALRDTCALPRSPRRHCLDGAEPAGTKG
jgi:hypothetical protein